MPPNTVYVGRPTKYGNPYSMADGLERETCIEFYEAWLQDQLRKDPHLLDPLKGKDLACFCPLDKPCHADVLLQVQDRRVPSAAGAG
jgi:hypothetical protein